MLLPQNGPLLPVARGPRDKLLTYYQAREGERVEETQKPTEQQSGHTEKARPGIGRIRSPWLLDGWSVATRNCIRNPHVIYQTPSPVLLGSCCCWLVLSLYPPYSYQGGQDGQREQRESASRGEKRGKIFLESRLDWTLFDIVVEGFRV